MWGGTDVRGAIRTVQAALDRGITLIDTAPVYGFGRAEEIVGKALAIGHRRDRVLIATKCGLEWHGTEIHRNATSLRIRQEVEESLKRLRTDRIDIYQLHWPDPFVRIEETAAALAGLLKEGKIRAIGLSNFDAAQMEQFRRVAPLHTTQPPYNLFERGIEADVLPYAQKTGLVVLAYGALCRGLLSGRMSSSTRFPDDDLRRIDPKFQPSRFNQYLTAVTELDRFARENIRPEYAGTGGALDPRSRSYDRIVGSTSARAACRHRSGDGVVARCGGDAGDRPDPRTNDHQPRGSRIHGNRRKLPPNVQWPDDN